MNFNFYGKPMKPSRIQPYFCLFFISLFGMSESYSQLRNPKSLPYEWSTDTSKRNIELSEITMVLPRGSFPTIDYPEFIHREQALGEYFNEEPVLSVVIGRQAKAYPLNVLTMHEISNDILSGRPILLTYCPLCNSSVVYDRRISIGEETRILEFEVSGMLRNSDMIMADKESESWWQQLTGESIVGKYMGIDLQVIPSVVISMEEFFDAYPNGMVLSRSMDTKAKESYGTNPYRKYDRDAGAPYKRFFDYSDIDHRLPPMERIVAVEHFDGVNKRIYPFSVLRDKRVVHDTFQNQELVVFYSSKTISILDERDISKSRRVGSTAVFSSDLDGLHLTFKAKNDHFVDDQTGSIWTIAGICVEGPLKNKHLQIVPHGNHFAFAWLSFHPDSDIYEE